jgi:hypothetical protein
MTQPKDTPQPQTVFMKCKNPSGKCASIEAVEVKGAPGVRSYQCVKCKFRHGVMVGGKMDLRYL